MRKFEKPYIPNVSSFFPDKSLNKNLLPQILIHLSPSDWGSASLANSHWYNCAHQEVVMKSVGQNFQGWLLRKFQNRPDIFLALESLKKVELITFLVDPRIPTELKLIFLAELRSGLKFSEKELNLYKFVLDLMRAFRFSLRFSDLVVLQSSKTLFFNADIGADLGERIQLISSLPPEFGAAKKTAISLLSEAQMLSQQLLECVKPYKGKAVPYIHGQAQEFTSTKSEALLKVLVLICSNLALFEGFGGYMLIAITCLSSSMISLGRFDLRKGPDLHLPQFISTFAQTTLFKTTPAISAEEMTEILSKLSTAEEQEHPTEGPHL